jgi:hypothetical protein
VIQIYAPSSSMLRSLAESRNAEAREPLAQSPGFDAA